MKTPKKVELPKLTLIERGYFDLLSGANEVVDRSRFGRFHDSMWNSNVVDVHMRNLRNKLKGLYEITTVRGVGYIMQGL